MKRFVLAVALFIGTAPAFSQQFPTVPDRTLIGRIGAGGGQGPSQAIPWATILSKGILDQVGTAQGTIPCRGVSVWGPLTPGAAGTLLSSAGTTICPVWIATVPVASGGTGSGTPAGARTNLNVESYTAHNDSNYSILATDRTVGTNAALTAPRTWTLPAASAFIPGQEILVTDTFGGVTAINTLTIARAGSDTINGATTTLINTAFGSVLLRSDGVSKWSIVGSGASSSLPFRTPMDYGALCDGSSDDHTPLQNWLNGISGTYIGLVPPGKVCTFSLYIFALSNTTIYGYGGTLKARNSSNANTGLTIGDSTQGTAVGPSKVAIYGLTFDGNKANRTGPFSAANFYVISATDVIIKDTKSINCGGDCYYAGGNITLGGVSTRVEFSNIVGQNPTRNGTSVVGVSNFRMNGFEMTGATTTSPFTGVDVEPDSTNTANSDFWISNGLTGGNSGYGIQINPAAIAGAAINRGLTSNVSANSNTTCGFNQVTTGTTQAGHRFVGVSGAANGTLLCGLAADKVP